MPEPVTIAALAVGALTWTGLAALSGHVGNVTDRLACNFLRAYRHRVAGLRGLPENHDLARAVRTAQMQALERLIRDFRELHEPAWKIAPETRPQAFVTKALAFCAHTVGRSHALHVKLDLEVTEPLARTIEGILGEPVSDGAASQRIEAIAFFAENAVLDELSEQLGDVSLPPDFDAYFRKGSGEAHPRFLDLFGAYMAEQIKDHPRVHAILTTGQLARIEGLAFDATEMLYRIETHFTGVVGEFRVLIDRLTADLSLSNTEKTALAANLGQVKADLNGTIMLVGGFLETLVGRCVPPEQFATTLFRIAADWKTAGERIDALVFSRNLSPQLTDLKDRATAAHKAGRLDEAAGALSEIDRIESDALGRLEAHEREVREEMRSRRVGIAETRMAQAALARVRLAYREEAEHYLGAARVVAAEAVPRLEWGYIVDAASALYDQGHEFGDNGALIQAVELYRDEALPRAPREQRAEDWARTENYLANALLELGKRESGTMRLEEAVATYRAALEEWTRDRVPLEWAEVQMSLGTALMRIGEREGGTTRLEEAVATHRVALEELTRDRVPFQWARTQGNIGTALWTLGRRESGTTRLEEAVAAYRAALEELTRDQVPLDWAAVQNNLGNVLQELGKRESGTMRLEEAVATYRAALEERTRDRVPLDWAMTQNNLGNALGALGEGESGTTRLEEAVSAYRAALEEWTRDRVPLEWAGVQNNLGNVFRALGERESGTVRLEEAVAAHRAALEEWTRDRAPLHWAMTQNNLANALGILGKRESGTTRLEEAVTTYREALEEWTRDRVPLDWAMTQNNLGDVFRALGEQASGTAHLEQAVAAKEACLTLIASVWPLEWIEEVCSDRNEIQAEITRRLAN